MDYMKMAVEVQSMTAEQYEALLSELPKDEQKLMRIYFNLEDTTPEDFGKLENKIAKTYKISPDDFFRYGLRPVIAGLVQQMRGKARAMTAPAPDSKFNPFN